MSGLAAKSGFRVQAPTVLDANSSFHVQACENWSK